MYIAVDVSILIKVITRLTASVESQCQKEAAYIHICLQSFQSFQTSAPSTLKYVTQFAIT